jgi:hypothetical protein
MRNFKRIFGIWVGIPLGILVIADSKVLAADVAQPATKVLNAKESAPSKSVAKAIQVIKGDSVAPIVSKTETSAEVARRLKHAEAVKNTDLQMLQMSQNYVKTVREQEKARREAEKAGKTKMAKQDVTEQVKKAK